MGCSVSPARWALVVGSFLACCAAGPVGCASALPGEVAHEAKGLDLDACLRNEPSCVKTGSVGGTEAIFEGAHAVSMVAPASIRLPLLRTSGGTRLRWLALGLRSYASNSTLQGGRLTVTIDGRDPVTVAPNPGFARVEVDMGELQPAADARVTIAATDGQVQLIYAVGRWDE